MPYPLPFLANTRDAEVEREIWRNRKMLVTDQEPASLNKHSRRKGTTLQKQLVPFCWLPKSISHVYISTQLLPSMHPASRMENSQRVKADSERMHYSIC